MKEFSFIFFKQKLDFPNMFFGTDICCQLFFILELLGIKITLYAALMLNNYEIKIIDNLFTITYYYPKK